MAVTIVTGVFAVLLAVLSWLLTNGSKRGRLLSRIERQTAVLKDLPSDHPARAELDQSLVADVTALSALAGPSRAPTPDRRPSQPRSAQLRRMDQASIVAGLLSVVAALIAAMTSFYVER